MIHVRPPFRLLGIRRHAFHSGLPIRRTKFTSYLGAQHVETIAKASTVDYRPEHLFVLRQARESLRFLQAQIAARDVEVHQVLSGWEEGDVQQQPLSPTHKMNRGQSKHAPLPFNLREQLMCSAFKH